MIIKDRSSTMRHMSRTHRVALDWLFDRVNLDPKIQIKYVDTKNQLADILTKRNFARDEWNHLLCLLKIMNLSKFSCSHFLSILNPKTMSKRSMQERKPGEEPVLAKSKPVSLVSKRACTGFGYIIQPVNYGTPRRNSDLTSTEKSGRDRNENAPSSSQVWHRNENPRPSIEKSKRDVNQSSSRSSNENLMRIRAIQGHSGGALVDPELLNYVASPLGWKEYLYHVGGSFAMHSIVQAGLIAGGKGTKGGWQTAFFTALHSLGDELDEEYEDVTKPRKVQYESNWNITQDANYWVNFEKAKNKGLQFWQSRLHAIILKDAVPADCIGKVVGTRQDKILYQRIPTLRPPPKVVLKNAWQVKWSTTVQGETASKLISVFKEYRRMQYLNIEDERPWFRTWRILSRTQSRTESMITNLQKTDVFNTFSEESKRTIQSLGKIELFELGEVSTTTQCPSCAKYWPEKLLHCTCGQIERRRKNLTHCQYASTLHRRDPLAGQNVGNLKNNTIISKQMNLSDTR